jgi:hypothetical protein
MSPFLATLPRFHADETRSQLGFVLMSPISSIRLSGHEYAELNQKQAET